MSKEQDSQRLQRSDTRAISTQVGYILTIGIIAILMAGLISSTGGFVSQTIDQGTQTELQIIGDRIAAQVMAADRILTRDNGPTTLVLDADVSEQAGESSYTISSDGSELVLESVESEVTVSIPFRTELDVEVRSSQASEWRVYSDGDDKIRIGSAEDAKR